MSQPESPSTELRFSERPSRADTNNNCTATLAWLKINIAAIYSAGRTTASEDRAPTLTREAYLNLYSTVHDYCMATRDSRKSHPQPQLSGGDLYNGLEDAIKAHCSETRVYLLAPASGADIDGARHVIAEYLTHWRKLTHLAGLVTNLLRPLEADWIQRGISAKAADMYRIKDLHTVIWKQEILQVGVDSTEAATGSKIENAAKLLQHHGEIGSESDKALAERFVESIKNIGVGLGKGDEAR
ncbi:hypothetical protein WHR41_08180 [Cladosporium halotolerans]|uniref:Cullin N-terminal domain-containing protein n=1 Tax=Cladosporium halotolerans TaxID=1052096 RepID=A0AB34KE70_9PEZI